MGHHRAQPGRGRVGDPVERGDEIGEVETDKAAMPIESPVRGVLLAVLVDAGVEVRPGQRIAIIGSPGETLRDLQDPAAAPITVP